MGRRLNIALSRDLYVDCQRNVVSGYTEKLSLVMALIQHAGDTLGTSAGEWRETGRVDLNQGAVQATIEASSSTRVQ